MDKRPNTFSLKNMLLLGGYYLLLFVMVTATTTSLVAARYHTENVWDPSADVAKFNPEIEVLTEDLDCYFSNADASMNKPYAIEYAVRNFQKGSTEYSEVALRYSLIFYIPKKTLANCALFQLAKTDTDAATGAETVTAITPLYDLAAMMQLSDGETLDTDSSHRYFYPAVQEETLHYTADTATFTGTAVGSTEILTTISCETAYIDTATQTYFAIWLDETTLIEPQMVVTRSAEDVEYLKLTISRPEFVLEPGVASEHRFDLLFMPTQGMSDQSAATQDIDPEFRTEWNAFYETVKSTATVQTTPPALNAYDGKTYIHLNLKGIVNDSVWELRQDGNGNLVLYETPKGSTEPNEPYTNFLVGYINDQNTPNLRYSYGKTYPCRMNALFEQID